MNVGKRFDRLKQWAGERVGSGDKTDVSDEFKSLEIEMGLRHEGMKANQKVMNAYVRALSKREDGEERGDKPLAVGAMGQTMTKHGEEFEGDSEFGQCLTGATCPENASAAVSADWKPSPGSDE